MKLLNLLLALPVLVPVLILAPVAEAGAGVSAEASAEVGAQASAKSSSVAKVSRRSVNGSAHTVVLLHGLARSAGSMAKMEAALQQAGYTTCNVDYPSTKYPVEELASRHVLPHIRACMKTDAAIHFVTHSMGGIILRQIRHSEPGLRVGRVVMLGPPNHGSELVDNMGDWRLFQWVNGPAGQQLRTAATSLPNRLGPATFELGVIAGNKPFLEPFTGYIAGPSDGKVSVESAKLAGMQDYLVLPVTHSFMMRNADVIAQTIGFLREGRFDHAAAADGQGGR